MVAKEKIMDILLKDFRRGHSEYQIENFIIGSEVHPWHRYQQCLREIKSRKEGIENQSEIAIILKEEIESLSRRRFLGFGKNRRKAEKRKRELQKILRSISETQRELNVFIRVALKIRNNFRSDLTDEKKKFLESDAWRKKAEFMMCLDLYCFGHPSRQTVEFIYKLPKEAKREVITKFSKVDRNKIMRNLIDT